MKLNLLSGVALALVIGASSSAWANPKNSFADGNTITVTSTAAVTTTAGHSSAPGGNCRGGGCTNAGDPSADGRAWSESFNTSIEGVDHQILTASTNNNFQTTTSGLTTGNRNRGNANARIANGGASASAAGPGVSVSAAAAGAGNLALQAVSIGAGADVSF